MKLLYFCNYINDKLYTEMKKILLFMLLLMPLTMMAADNETLEKYGLGKVPEENGLVVFEKNFKVPGWTDQKIHETLYYYLNNVLVANGIQDVRTRMTTGAEEEVLAARIEEWIVFKKMFLYLDQARFRYQATASVKDNKVNIRISQISYQYQEECEDNKPTGKGGITYVAEEWISDKAALNKKGTRIFPRSGKFRKKTIDRVGQIFENLMDLFEAEAKDAATKATSAPAEKKRKFVEE